MKYDVFISYSRKDIEIAKSVCTVLDDFKKYYDFEYFFDTSEIKGRDEYLKRISKAIVESKTLLFLASQNSYDSEFCAKELLFADKRGVHIHQYRIDAAEMPMDLDMLLGTHQYREMKTTPIEVIVREVLADALGCEVSSLETLNANNQNQKQQEAYKQELREAIKALEQRGFEIKMQILSYQHQILELERESGEVEMQIADLRSKLGIEEVAPKKVPTKQVQPLVVKKIYKVGDLYDDGKKQGVVFEVSADGKHGKIVSLDEARLSWCTPSQFDKKIAVGAYSESDGRANTDKVMSRTDSKKYPAFTWCRDKGVDWYLPSVGELSSLSKVKDKINKALVAQSREKLRSGLYRYWSSTEKSLMFRRVESSFNVNMSNGKADCPNKTNKGYVRAVATF